MDEKEEFLQVKMTEEIAAKDNWDRKHLITELSSIKSEQLLVEQGIERIRNIDRMLGTNTGLDRNVWLIFGICEANSAMQQIVPAGTFLKKQKRRLQLILVGTIFLPQLGGHVSCSVCPKRDIQFFDEKKGGSHKKEGAGREKKNRAEKEIHHFWAKERERAQEVGASIFTLILGSELRRRRTQEEKNHFDPLGVFLLFTLS
ncbi:hypothetical protein TIFTF001_050896 [Ficus carica]|uniref:Uncharacterized protein n=1 Tax=Ficus carica TaxID=3494 RepID=A0AA88CUS4_FICCA|nr:hypothetical protein TIFTF001_050896 [Ficus carica]